MPDKLIISIGKQARTSDLPLLQYRGSNLGGGDTMCTATSLAPADEAGGAERSSGPPEDDLHRRGPRVRFNSKIDITTVTTIGTTGIPKEKGRTRMGYLKELN